MLADHCRELKAVEVGHADVDQNDRDIASEQLIEGFRRRTGLYEVLPELLQDRFIAQQLGRLIVDQKDVDFGIRAIHRLTSHLRDLYRCSHIRNADRSCSVSTGLAR